MKRIFKYPLKLQGTQKIKIPKHAKILNIQTQEDDICLWALINPEEPKVSRQIRIFGTGHEVPDIKLEYIGTIQQLDGSLIWHVFEELEV